MITAALCEVLRNLYRPFFGVSQILDECSGRVSAIDLGWGSGGDVSMMVGIKRMGLYVWQRRNKKGETLLKMRI